MNKISVRPLWCPGCKAAVPLAEQAEVACGSCGSTVAMPTTHVEALRTSRRAAELRRAIEPLWQTLAQPVGGWVELVGLLAIVLLPVVATLVASLVPNPPLGRVEIYALVTLPALLPGAATYLWAEAVNATVIRFRDAMSAQPPAGGGSPSCRNCDAPLTVEPDAIASTCEYCATDNLVAEVPKAAIQRKLREALDSLDEAAHKLRMRKLALGLGATAIVVLVAAISIALHVAAMSA